MHPEPILEQENGTGDIRGRREKRREKKLLLLPYIKGVSEKIGRVCAPLGVRPVFKSHNTLRQLLMRVKSNISEEQKV